MPRRRFETAHCQTCGEVADVYSAGVRLLALPDGSRAMAYGQVFERCRNPRCAMSIEHVCRPDPDAPPPAERGRSYTLEYQREWRRDYRARRGETTTPTVEREVPIPGIDLSYIGI